MGRRSATSVPAAECEERSELVSAERPVAGARRVFGARGCVEPTAAQNRTPGKAHQRLLIEPGSAPVPDGGTGLAAERPTVTCQEPTPRGERARECRASAHRVRPHDAAARTRARTRGPAAEPRAPTHRRPSRSRADVVTRTDGNSTRSGPRTPQRGEPLFTPGWSAPPATPATFGTHDSPDSSGIRRVLAALSDPSSGRRRRSTRAGPEPASRDREG